MRKKKAKLTIASIMLVSLIGCANNNRDDLHSPQHVSTGDLNQPIHNTNVSNQSRNGIYPLNTSMEIQRMNNGYITIEHNSYSTGIPSHQFPQSRVVQDGQNKYYTFESFTPQTGNVNQPGISSSPVRTNPSAAANVTVNQLAMQVIQLTNNERRKQGLPPLSVDKALCKVAQTKSNEMKNKHYFSHTSPAYGSPFEMMRDFGVTYRSAGENIAMGQPTAQQVVKAWMKSEGHRKNILSPNYTNIGVGYTSSGNYWSQMFIGKQKKKKLVLFLNRASFFKIILCLDREERMNLSPRK